MQQNKKKTAKCKEIKTEFSAGALTNYSGIKPVYDFMQKLGIKNSFNSLNINMHHNTKYDTGTILSIIILGIISGNNRISKIENFTMDPLVQKMFDLNDKISDSTIIERMKRFSMKQTTEYMELIGKISNQIHSKLSTERDILDIDSSVKTVYGKQQGTAKGYNGSKRGARSYHPLLAFLNSTRECLLSWLRPGNSYTANGADEFFQQACFNRTSHWAFKTRP